MKELTEFLEKPSINNVVMKSGKKFRQIMSQVNKLLNQDLVINSAHERGEFISPIFLRPKPNGSNLGILNFKNLKQSLEYNHFKLETIHSVPHLIQQYYYMVKIDLKEAY